MTLHEEAERIAGDIRGKPDWARTRDEQSFLEAWEKHKDAPTADYARKITKLQELISQMHPKDRAVFQRAREKYKPDIDHDLFVASLHVPPRGAKLSR